MPDLKIAIFLRKIGEKLKFRFKRSEYQNSPGPLLIQKEIGNSNMFCKFQHNSMQIFFKMVNYVFLKLRTVASTPSPSDFDGLPYPRVRWYPHFFHENDRKGCKRDYLYALGNFL